jgi:cytochrome c oxidase subunit 2
MVTIHTREPRRSPGGRALPGVTLALAVALLASACAGSFPQSTFRPASEFAGQLDDLYLTIFWWAMAVFVVVEGLLVYVIVRYRARPGAPPPAPLHGNTLLEIAWTLAPVVILISIAVPTIRLIFETDGTPDDGALAVEVVGRQWWWEFRYPELGIVTANELRLPVGRQAALQMTSDDVIHSFWVPRLGGKRDLTLGRTTRLAFTPDSVGTFPGQCAEFCGPSHANMRVRVEVLDSAAFAAWVAQETRAAVSPDSLTPELRRGYEEFAETRDPPTNSCWVCHAVTGVSGGAAGPSLTHLGNRGTIAAGLLPNTVEQLTRWLRDPSAIKPGSRMPTIPLTDAEIADLVAYLRSLR